MAQEDVGKLTNLMATDADKFGMFEWLMFNMAQWTFSLLSLPFIVLVMHAQLGSAAYLGLAITLLSNFISTRCVTDAERGCRERGRSFE